MAVLKFTFSEIPMICLKISSTRISLTPMKHLPKVRHQYSFANAYVNKIPKNCASPRLNRSPKPHALAAPPSDATAQSRTRRQSI